MADVDHKDILFAYMHPPAAIDFAVDPAVFVPPASGFLYFHAPSGTQWRSTGTSAGALQFVGYSKDFKPVTRTAAYQLDSAVRDIKQDVMLLMNTAAPVTVTVPLNSTAEFPVGYRLPIYKVGLGNVGIVAALGVTLRTPGSLFIEAQFNFGTLIKLAANLWYFLPNGVGGAGDFDSILTDPIAGSVLVDPLSGNVLVEP